MLRTTMIAVAMVALATTVWADVAAGDACAANLTADGKTIYAAVVAANPTLDTLRTTVETQARSLVMDGKVAMGSGRENARAAGDACAANLTADGKTIFAAVVAANPTLETLRSTVESQARSLVMDGKVAMGSGRDNAQAAGECMRARLQ